MSRAAILVMGTNCLGKTTAVQLATDTYKCDDRVEIIHGDIGSEWISTPDVVNWRIAKKWRSQVPVIVVEGTNRIIRAASLTYGDAVDSGRSLHVYVVMTDPETLKVMLQSRCSKRGKTFRADYWTTRVCQSELGRYPKLAARFPVVPKVFNMTSDYADQLLLAEAIRRDIASSIGDPVESDAPFKLG